MAQLTKVELLELQEIQNEINLKIANINSVYFEVIRERLDIFTTELDNLQNN